jgi:hypothetical protein
MYLLLECSSKKPLIVQAGLYNPGDSRSTFSKPHAFTKKVTLLSPGTFSKAHIDINVLTQI